MPLAECSLISPPISRKSEARCQWSGNTQSGAQDVPRPCLGMCFLGAHRNSLAVLIHSYGDVLCLEGLGHACRLPI